MNEPFQSDYLTPPMPRLLSSPNYSEAIMQTTQSSGAVELWREACYDYGGMSIEGGWGERNAAPVIQQLCRA